MPGNVANLPRVYYGWGRLELEVAVKSIIKKMFPYRNFFRLSGEMEIQKSHLSYSTNPVDAQTRKLKLHQKEE